MAKNLFVGSLPFSVSDDALGQLFAQCGSVVSANVIKDRYSGRSRGFGFVEMGSDEEAKQAIEKLNGYNLEGRNIVVKEALPKPDYSEDRGNNPGGRGGFGGRGGPSRRGGRHEFGGRNKRRY